MGTKTKYGTKVMFYSSDTNFNILEKHNIRLGQSPVG